jgi:fructoselysine-6-P-deglycase FrlB-like protein
VTEEKERTKMSFVADEIASQPETWRRAAELAADPLVATALPEPGARVAAVGCGTSLYVAQAYAQLRESLGLGETDAYAASQFPRLRSYDHVLALTRSGTTTEVITLLRNLPRGARSTAVTTHTRHPVTRYASARVVLDFADEHSVVQTRFATTTLALLRAHLGGDMHAALGGVRDELAGEVPARLLEREQFTFLGDGWTVGLANEAALKLRETAQMWAESYPAMEFRHGPISVVDRRSAVWFFGPAPEGLADEVARTGALAVEADRDPMVHLVAAQRLAVALAARRGLDPDQPRNLTRSIILPAAA